MRTWLTDTFGLDVPLVGAPMAGVADGRLAAAISRARALGMVGAGAEATPRWIAEQAEVAAASGRPYGVGLMAWAQGEQAPQVDAVLGIRPNLVSVSFGDYTRHVPALRAAGMSARCRCSKPCWTPWTSPCWPPEVSPLPGDWPLCWPRERRARG